MLGRIPGQACVRLRKCVSRGTPIEKSEPFGSSKGYVIYTDRNSRNGGSPESSIRDGAPGECQNPTISTAEPGAPPTSVLTKGAVVMFFANPILFPRLFWCTCSPCPAHRVSPVIVVDISNHGQRQFQARMRPCQSITNQSYPLVCKINL